ncbi:MAG: hypothetical protein ABIJ09_02045 [Pseudomonadota bacterium]
MNMQAHIDRLETQLKHWGETLDALVAKVDAAGADATFVRRRHVSDLQAKYHSAQLKIDELKAAGSEKWQTLRGGVDSAWKDLEHAFKDMKN